MKLWVPSPLGGLLLEGEDDRLTGLWFREGDIRENSENPLPVLVKTREWLEIYFSGRDPGFRPLCAPQGSPFDRVVWQILEEIPYGVSRTYGEIARETALRLGRERMSAQAVGGAVGRNPISLVIPCHRVLGVGGRLTGYGWGLERKASLLSLEGIPFREENRS